MVREILIDCSEMEAPQPFEEVLKQLGKIQPGEYLHMLHRKQPLPLVQLLEENGYGIIIQEGQTKPWDIIIWNKADPQTSDYCQSHYASAQTANPVSRR